MASFLGKVVLITGASSGIGAATAIQFSKLGANLVITGRNRNNLDDVSEKCFAVHTSSEKPHVVVGDVSNENDVEKLLTGTIERFGKLDVLVNNAGVLEVGSIENTNLEQYDRIFNINVRSIYQLSSLAVPYLTHTKGNIVNVSSVNAIRSFPNVLAYCMSKAALDQFTRCTALELAPRQIRVNSVNPGVIVTDIHKRAGMSSKEYEEFLKKCQETHALGRAGDVEEVAKAITFIASDDASFITGASIPVDGGRHAMCPR